MKNRISIRTPKDIMPIVKRYANCRQENFLAITLDGAHQVIKLHHVSKGLVNKTIVHPRETYYPAIRDNAVAIIFAHNHPSGRSLPSDEDKELTKRLCMAGEILGIHVLDHIIFTKDSHEFCSMREYGFVPDNHGELELARYAAEFSRKRAGEE